MNEKEKRINEGSHLVKDLVQGDESIANRYDFSELEMDELQKAFQLLLKKSESLPNSDILDLVSNSWKINYRVKPPSIEEFLTAEYIGSTADHLYPHVKDILTSFWQPDSGKRHLLLSTAIGVGKSLISTLWSLYVTVHLWSMRDPKKFFDLSTATSIVHLMISFTMDKAKQVLLQPFFQILLTSEKFKRIKMEERLQIKQEEEYPDKICFTTAGKMGVLQFYNDIHYVLASSPENVLGLNVITATLSEISFFIDKGFSTEYISRVYNDSKGRVYSRFRNSYLSGTVIDSSPNDIQLSPIDKYIFEGYAEQDPLNMVITGTQWDFLPQNFPKWQKTGETFPVFRGEAGVPPEILSEHDLQKYRKDAIYRVPIDVKQFFIDDLLKSVKDYCGYPSGSQGTLIRDEQYIENMFVPDLQNVYSFVSAPDDKPAEGLIWEMLKSRFFIPFDKGYEFYRNPLEKRYMHIDQSLSGDVSGISMVHPELNEQGDIVYITDFTIAISPEKKRINLNAIRLFVVDLVEKGRLNIAKVTFDNYESSQTITFLKDKGIEAGRLSVESDIRPYRNYINLIQSERVYAGKNIILKNNIKSLQEVKTNSGKRKIDHTKGKTVYSDHGNWHTSEMGKFANDVSDSHCGAIWNALNEFRGIPLYRYEKPKIKEEKKEEVSRSDLIKEKVKKEMLERHGLTSED